MSRSRFRSNRVILDVDSLKGGPYRLSTGVTLWIELSPGWSRLQNRSTVQLQILSKRSEVRAQSLANKGDTFLPLSPRFEWDCQEGCCHLAAFSVTDHCSSRYLSMQSEVRGKSHSDQKKAFSPLGLAGLPQKGQLKQRGLRWTQWVSA